MVITADGNIHLLDIKTPLKSKDLTMHPTGTLVSITEVFHDGYNVKDLTGNDFWMTMWFPPSTPKGKILYTTDPSFQGVKQLKRELFVRYIDKSELADTAATIFKENKPNLRSESSFIDGFIEGAGYNAKKGEFTESQMYDCALAFFYHWYNSPGTNTAQGLQEWLPKHIASLRPISLPQSLTIENDNIKINW